MGQVRMIHFLNINKPKEEKMKLQHGVIKLRKYKYEDIAKVGDVIKAYDFERIPGYPDSYVIGKVVAKGENIDDKPYACFKVALIQKAEKEADGTIDDYTAVCLAKGAFHWYIPFEIAGDDYDGRIEKLDNPWEILADERKRGK